MVFLKAEFFVKFSTKFKVKDEKCKRKTLRKLKIQPKMAFKMLAKLKAKMLKTLQIQPLMARKMPKIQQQRKFKAKAR